jgi:hypothetical protein
VRAQFQKPGVYIAIGSILTVGAYPWGLSASIGMLTGILATTLTWFGWWIAIKLLTSDPSRQRLTGCGTVVIFVMKLPIWIGLLFYAKSLGDVAAQAFIFGTLVVYSLAVAWAQTREE